MCLGVPVVALAGEVVAALDEQDPLAGGRELPGEHAAARAAANEHDVLARIHRDLELVSAP